VGSNSAGASSGTAVSVSRPAGIQSGDIVIAFVNANNTPTISDNNGSYSFTQVLNQSYNGTSASYGIFYRVAGSSEPSSYAFTLASSQRWEMIAAAYRGVDAGIFSAFPTSSTHTYGTTSSVTTSAVSGGLTAGDMVVAVAGGDSNSPTFTGTPSGWNSRQNLAGYQMATLADIAATGTNQSAALWTASTSIGWGANILALKMAAVQQGRKMSGVMAKKMSWFRRGR